MFLSNFLDSFSLEYLASRYSVSYWYGRTGNNIQQIANGLILAEKLGKSFEQELEHDLITKFEYNFGKDGIKTKRRFFSWQPLVDCSKSNFYGSNEIGVSKEYIFQNLRRICKEYVRPNLKVPSVGTLDEETLVIHIRGGDIFEHEYKIPTNYVQNPLSFYLTIISKFENTLVVVEPNSKNPVLNELQKIPNLKFQSSSPVEDFATLLSAKNLATSGVGTFAIAAAFCSSNIKNLFVTNIYLTEHLNHSILYNSDINITEYQLRNYIPVYPCNWKNSREQRNLMLDYKMVDEPRKYSAKNFK
jgi:hypothetical protein